MKTFTLGFLIFCCSLFSFHAFGQDLDKKGIKILTNESLSQSQQAQLIAFDFESYRKANQSVFIKIIDGPTIELFAKNPNTNNSIDKASVKANSEHLTPSERALLKIEIIQVNVFKAQVK